MVHEMSYQIIQQPGGLFAVFCTQRKTIIFYDATDAEIMDWFVELETRRVRERVAVILGQVLRGELQQMSWDEALERDREHGGQAHTVFSEL
jgi:hypothetical protein